jgi:hypothetical protein
MISYTYEKITIDLTGDIRVVVFTLNTAQPGRQIVIDHMFAAGTGAAAIDTAIAQKAAIVWSLQT